MTDFRAERMESPEGRGIAKAAWEKYATAVNRAARPVFAPLLKRAAAKEAADLLGFWLVWHLEGGFEGLRRGGMSRATIYRRIQLFRKVTGRHPDEFNLPGVSLDLAAYTAAGTARKR